MTRADEAAAYRRALAKFPRVEPPKTVAGQRRLINERLEQMRRG